MNKGIHTDPHCFLMVVGPSGSGKTHLVLDMLRKQEKIFYPKFDQILYFYQCYQKKYRQIQFELGSSVCKLVNGIDWQLIDAQSGCRRTLIVFDDMYHNVSKSAQFLSLVYS